MLWLTLKLQIHRKKCCQKRASKSKNCNGSYWQELYTYTDIQTQTETDRHTHTHKHTRARARAHARTHTHTKQFLDLFMV